MYAAARTLIAERLGPPDDDGGLGPRWLCRETGRTPVLRVELRGGEPPVLLVEGVEDRASELYEMRRIEVWFPAHVMWLLERVRRA